MRLVLALGLGLLLCATPARADSFASVGADGVFGNPANGPFESFFSSMQFDRTTQTLSSMQYSSFGSLGTFTFDRLSIAPTIVNTKLGPMGTTAYRFLWDNGVGDHITFID